MSCTGFRHSPLVPVMSRTLSLALVPLLALPLVARADGLSSPATADSSPSGSSGP